MNMTLEHAALNAVDESLVPPNRRRALHAIPGSVGPLSLASLAQASKKCNVPVYQNREKGPDRGTFYMDAKIAVPQELEPFLAPLINAEIAEVKQTTNNRRTLLAGAAAGLGGGLGAHAVAMPAADKDPAGYEAVKRRLASVGPGVRESIAIATQKAVVSLPSEMAVPFKRTLTALRSLFQVKTHQHNRVR